MSLCLSLEFFFFVVVFLNPSLNEEYESTNINKKCLCFALKERNSSQCIVGTREKRKHIWEAYRHYYRM